MHTVPHWFTCKASTTLDAMLASVPIDEMQQARDASKAYSRIAVLSAHLTAAKNREPAISCSVNDMLL